MEEGNNSRKTVLEKSQQNQSEKSDYLNDIFEASKKLARSYHAVVLINGAIVKSDPIFLWSKKTKNRFAKFTIELRSAMPWDKIKNLPPEQRGDVYLDCLAFENKRNAPGKYILENIRKGAVISGVAVIKSGHKPVKKEGDEYRANWVYGDYIYLNIRDIKIDREAPIEKTKSPYKENVKYSPYYRPVSENQTVSDEDIVFNI